eukprot:gene4252-6031_t
MSLFVIRSSVSRKVILSTLVISAIRCISSSSDFAFTSVAPAPGNPFHLAIPVHSMNEARKFYGDILRLDEGRRSEDKWQDYSLYGHQVVCHYVGDNYRCIDFYNPVDGDEVPVPHFGIVLTEPQFHALSARLIQNGINFIIEPHKRFLGQPGEQWTMFFKDPSGNNLEFKALTNPNYLFAKYNVVDNK